MKTFVSAFHFFACALLCLGAASAGAQDAARQDHGVLRKTVEQFLRMRSTGLPGDIHIAVGAIDSRLSLPACAAPEAFLPNGSRVWGRTTVGVRCMAPSPWTIYVPATVKVVGEYIVTAVPLAQGQVVAQNDLAALRGDLTALPPGIVTDAREAIGRTVTMSLRAGVPLRGDTLRSLPAVKQGQVVRLVTDGPGFQVSAEGRALANGAEGQVIQARTSSGQVVSGIARAGGVVEVTY